MAALTVTNTFAVNTTILSGAVNTNFTDITTYITNRNNGSATWDNCYVTNATSVPLQINNSTGTINIANFQDNGTNVFQIVDGGDVYMNPLKKLFLDGGGDTYILESVANVFAIITGGTTRMQIDSTGFGIPSATNFWLDGVSLSGDTYLTESSANIMDFTTGGVLALRITSAQILDYRLATIAAGGGASATLATIGGSGPATAGQNSWIKIKVAGTDSFIPIWR